MRNISLSVLLITYFFLPSQVVGQSKRLTYQLQGVVNRDTGTAILLPISGPDFDPNPTNKYQAKIKQGHFLFEGKMAYPGSYLLKIEPGYVSSDFLIEPGIQTIICMIDSLREIPKLATKTMTEHRLFATYFVQPIAQKRERAFEEYQIQKSAITEKRLLDSLRTTYTQTQTHLAHQQQLGYLIYITQHPTSYVALWQLVKDMRDGYRPVFDSLYNAFSASLKSTPTGQKIAQRLRSSRVTAIGQLFPVLTVVDMTNKSILITFNPGSKYTLIDFWFSHCGPCLQEFPQLKDLFATYQAKGLNIIGISIDKPIDRDIWKKTVREKGLIWPQYVDPSGSLTVDRLSIGYFPSNFLLDEKGTIIRKDISPIDLGNFLSGRL